MSIKRRFLAIIICALMAFGLVPTRAMAAGNLPFTDVSTTDWFYNGVRYAYENGLMVGTSKTTFEPNTTTTRAMVVTILYRMDGSPVMTTGGTFTDVAADEWYTDAVKWAAANGIVSGYGNGRFGPNDYITREQMVTIINRYSKYKGYNISGQKDLSMYRDASQIHSWAKTAMAWAVEAGIISGKGNGILDPLGNATRAEVAQILKNYSTSNISTSDISASSQTVQKMDDTISTIESSFVAGANDDQNVAAAQNVISKIDAYLASLKKNHEITDYSQEGLTFEVNLPVGTYIYTFDADGMQGRNSGQNVVDDSPAVSLSNALLSDAKYAVLSAQPYASDLSSDVFDNAARTIENANLGYMFYDNLDNSAVTIDSMKHLSMYKVIIWDGHGGYSSDLHAAIGLGESATASKDKKYEEDLKQKRVVWMGGGTYAVTSEFFKHYYGQNHFNGSLIYIGACAGANDAVLANTLIDCGAEAVLAYRNSVHTSYNRAMCASFFTNLIQGDGNTGSTVTAATALAAAKKSNGDQDPTNTKWYDLLLGRYLSRANRAELILTENDDASFRLVDRSLDPSDDSQTQDYKAFNGHYYDEFIGCATWEDAQRYCESLGGHLATLTSQEENDFVYHNMWASPFTGAHFGLKRNSNGAWEWVTGEPVSYMNWHSGEPNSDANYAMFYYDLDDTTWAAQDFWSDGQTPFICEWDSEAAFNAYLSKK